MRDLAIHPRDHDLVIATHGRGLWLLDDIPSLRALICAPLAQPARFMPGTPVVQQLGAGGGWANGDAAFVGPNPPGDAVITYYLQKRHIFGDLALEVHDSTGKLLATLPTSKRRGLSRVAWAMRMSPPKIPPAATAGFGVGPRLLPGSYTVKLVEGDAVYSTALRVIKDPRLTHTAADRKAQYDLSLRLYGLLNDMTGEVDQMNQLRGELDNRTGALTGSDTLAVKLRNAAQTVDEFRKKIVATKEGGMITGEERLRENLVELYGSVVGYEGRPSQTQVDRTAAIARELSDVSKEFHVWMTTHLAELNAALSARKLPTLVP